MKRIVSLVLALSMVLSMFTFSFAGTTLPDVEGTDYEAAVSALVELGIVNGYEDGTYKADRTVSRAEMAKFLVVSAGLEPAADVNKGATKFSDVAASHWATGYINVATEYGYINGYPEGTFAPDATVSYAEAVTMAIRVLGYKSVVEAKGTWPTNYIAKAQELKVLEDVEYGKYTDGATRGNVALLIWNMLTTRMWDVSSENESNGLNYEQRGTMIDKYFEDYLYIDEEDEVIVTDIEVLDGKVTIDVDSRETTVNKDDETVPVYSETFELAKDVDFLNLFGRTVSILYNEKEEVAVMVIPSNDDKVVEGYAYDLNEDNYNVPGNYPHYFWGYGEDSGDVFENSYMVNTMKKSKQVESAIVYNIAGAVVDEIKEVSNGIRFTFLGDVVSPITIDEEAIVLIDGKWATAEDIEAGDVLSVLEDNELFIVSRDVVEGEFEAVEKKATAEDYFYNITVDGEEYDCVYTWVYDVIEVDEDGEDILPGTALNDILEADKDDDEYKFYGEDCRVFLNAIGEIIRIEFEEITEAAKGNFYVATNCPEAYWEVKDKNGTTVYMELNGTSYEVKSVVSGDSYEAVKSGDVVLAEFDSKDRVKELIIVDSGDLGNNVSEDYDFDLVVSGDEGELLDKKNYLSGDVAKYKVTANTVVYTIIPVEDEDDEDVVDHYEVEITKGPAALEGVETSAVVAIEKDDEFRKAAYVFVWEEAKNTEKTIGIVEEMGIKNGVEHVTIGGTKYNEVDEDSENYNVNDIATFVVNDDVVKVTGVYDMLLVDGLAQDNANIVAKVEGRVAVMEDDSRFDIDTKDEAYEDAKIYVVTVTLDKFYANMFDDIEEVSYEDMKLRAEDIVYEDLENDIVLIFRGYDFEA